MLSARATEEETVSAPAERGSQEVYMGVWVQAGHWLQSEQAPGVQDHAPKQ